VGGDKFICGTRTPAVPVADLLLMDASGEMPLWDQTSPVF
jgi:hypothetical protein